MAARARPCHHRAVTGTLFLVGTPIGNLGDLSTRARETLARVDLIAAEDTRRTGRLLKSLDVRRPLVSFFDANEKDRIPDLIVRLRDGHDVALVSDGGMPSVSDPGFRLVRACAAEGIDVRVIPGPSAVLSALVVSGLPTDRFTFEGFAPRKQGERMRRLEALREDPRTLVFFESPVRVKSLLRDLLVAFGDRPSALCRELTKLHEETIRGRISQVLASLGDSDVKGEVVVVVEGAREVAPGDLGAASSAARELVAGGMRKRDAARAAAERHGLAANDVYRELVN
jgi:16S rRNA (cytidine1402-2'-O)-methyltransferase